MAAACIAVAPVPASLAGLLSSHLRLPSRSPQNRALACCAPDRSRSDPHLECYADRILYIRDGRIEAQQINAKQTPLDAEAHAAFLAAEG